MLYQRLAAICLISALLTVSPFTVLAGNAGAGNTAYQEKCAMCHGKDGNPLLPGAPNFAKGERLEKADTVLAKSIIGGLNTMPPFRGMLSEAQIDDILAYVRKLKK